ncbi:MAG: hypothetical protein IJ400_02220 [Clostridia bacterium]|nr:hypothetical protein [Clostridia bacterium]
MEAQLKLFAESLKDIVSLDDNYSEYLNSIEIIQSKIETSDENIEEQLNEILSISEDLKKIDAGMYISISALEEALLPYIDGFNEKNNELKELDKPLEDKRNDRVEQFKETIKSEIEHDVENWQNKLEEEFSKNWFEYKDEWGGANTQKDKPKDQSQFNEGINSSQEDQEFDDGKKG